MKKIILAALLGSFAFAVHAIEVKWVSVGGEFGQIYSGTAKKDASTLSAGFLIGLDNGVVLEARNRTQQTDKVGNGSGSNNYGATLNWQEVGASKAFDVGITNVYARGLVGFHETTSKRYGWWASEFGIQDQIGKTPFSYQIGYRFIDSIRDQEENKGQNEQSRFSIFYRINKNHQVSVRYQKQTGDSPHDGFFYGYSYRF